MVPLSELKALRAKVRELEKLPGKKTMEVEILKDAIEIAREKTDLAHAPVAQGRYPMKAVTDTLAVSRSQQYVRQKAGARRRGKFKLKATDALALSRIRQVMAKRPTYGYRRVGAIVNRLRREEVNRSVINPKRMYRILKANGLLLPRYTGRPARSHDGTVMTAQSNRRWCSDGFEIRCDNGQRVRAAFSLDCCDREVMSYMATTGGIIREMVQDLILESIEKRFGQVEKLPQSVERLSDNDSPYTAIETRLTAQALGLVVCTRRTAARSPTACPRPLSKR